MSVWEDKTFPYARGKIKIDGQVFNDAYKIILQVSQKKQRITYTDIMNQLKQQGHKKINRGTIGPIIGEVSIKVSQSTSPSVYPSAIVVQSITKQPGDYFWGINTGTNPPNGIPFLQRHNVLKQYQQDVFNSNWYEVS